MKIIIILVCAIFVAAGFWFFDDFVAPLVLNSRIERLGVKNLPKASIERGVLVYCRMSADDFRFPLPPGSNATNLIIKSGGFDNVHGSIEVRFGNSRQFTAGDYQGWCAGKLSIVRQIAKDIGMMVQDFIAQS